MDQLLAKWTKMLGDFVYSSAHGAHLPWFSFFPSDILE